MNDWLVPAAGPAAAWALLLWKASWQGGLALGFVWLADRLLPALSPGARCWLWRLAYAKLLVTLVWMPVVLLPLLPQGSGQGSGTQRVPGVQGSNSNSNSNSNSRGSWPPARSNDARGVFPHPSGGVREFPSSSSILTPNAQRPTPAGGSHTHTSTHPYTHTVVALWLLGAAAVLLRLVASGKRTRELARGGLPVTDAAVLAEAREIAARLGVRRIPSVVAAEGAPGPLLVGVVDPVIVLPRALLDEGAAGDVRLVLAHELAHLKRRDLLWGCLPATARVLFFFHPLVWLVRRDWSQAQEIACDEMTLRAAGAPAGDYAELLVRLASRPRAGRDVGLAAVAAASSFRMLERRLSAMKRFVSVPGRRSPLGAGVLLLLGGLVLVPWRVVAQPGSPAPARPRATPPLPAGLPVRGAPAAPPAPDLLTPALPAAADAAPPEEKGATRLPSTAAPALTPRGAPPGADRQPVLQAQVEAARARLDLAQARLENAVGQAKAGIATSDVVPQAQAELARARAELVQAEAALKRTADAAAAALEARVEAARVQLDSAQQRLEIAAQRVKAGIGLQTEQLEAQAELAAARAALVQAEAAVKQARERAAAGDDAAEDLAAVRLKQAEVRLERLLRLRAAGNVAESEVDAARAALAQAQADLVAGRAARDAGAVAKQQAEAAAKKAQAESYREAVTDYYAKLKRAKGEKGAGAADLAQAKAEVARAEAELAQARAVLEQQTQLDLIRKKLAEVNARVTAKADLKRTVEARVAEKAGLERGAGAAPVPGDLARARLAAARERFELGLRMLRDGRGETLEDLYLWSRRWLDAERAVSGTPAARRAAAAAHVERMRDLEALARARFKAGIGTQADVSAAEYYRTEAEIGLRE